MSFRFPAKSKKPDLPGIIRTPSQILGDTEVLTGIVNGRDASDLEERFANALRKAGLGFYFQWLVETRYSLPAQEKVVDFIVYANKRVYPVEIYGDYFHESYGARQHDMIRERELNDVFATYGWEDLSIVWGHELQDQEQANYAVRRLFLV